MFTLNYGWRVWVVPLGDTEPIYLNDIVCDKLEHNGPVLCSQNLDDLWLRETQFNRLELHHDSFGVPSEYEKRRIRFICHAPIAADWWVEPMGSWGNGDTQPTRVYVHFHCSDIEVIKHDSD